MGWHRAHLAEVVDGEDPAPRAAVCILQAHELAHWMVGAPEAPSECSLQLIQVQGAMGHVWEGLGVHPGDLRAREDTGSGGASGSHLWDPECSEHLQQRPSWGGCWPLAPSFCPGRCPLATFWRASAPSAH